MKNELFEYLKPKLGCVEGCILTRRAMAVHWILFPIETLSWRLSYNNGFCKRTNSIKINGNSIGVRQLSMIMSGDKFNIQYKDGYLYVEKVNEPS